MLLNFSHPQNSDIFEAQIEGACTGSIAIKGLLEANFLEPVKRGTYDLVIARTNLPIAPDATFAACGVHDGDLVQVFRRGSGA